MKGERNSAKSAAASPPARQSRWQRNLLIALGLVVALGVGVHLAWLQFAATIARHPQYQITVDQIRTTPPPPWIHSDIRAEVLHDAGLVGTLSVLDDSGKLQE